MIVYIKYIHLHMINMGGQCLAAALFAKQPVRDQLIHGYTGRGAGGPGVTVKCPTPKTDEGTQLS